MRASRYLIAVALFLALPAGALARREKPEPVPCPDDVAAALAAACPCDTAANHGRHVRCVAGFRNLLRKSGCLTDDIRGMLRCAARSTCGRPSAVVCCLPSRVRPFVFRDDAHCVNAGGASEGPGSVCGACIPTTTSSSSSSTSTTSSSTSTTSSSTTSTTVPVGVTYGNAFEFATASAHSPDYLLGGPVMVAAGSTLTHLCVIGKAAGPNVVMGLYSSNAMGEPANLIASTPVTPLDVGPVEVPVTPTSLVAGKYWLFGLYDAEASIGLDESSPTAPVRYLERTFGPTLPQPFGPASSYAGQRFNYYVRVQ